MNSRSLIRFTPAALMMVLTVGSPSLYAQSTGSGSPQVSSQDKSYLEEIAKDSNFEIRSSELALQKSPSADVKAYATMVNHDHMLLKQQIRSVDGKVGVSTPANDSMDVTDSARLLELKALSGKAFDDAYIKGLVKGNAQSVKDAKEEYGNTAVPAVKALAERNVKLDEKHAARATQLAKAHGVDAQP